VGQDQQGIDLHLHRGPAASHTLDGDHQGRKVGRLGANMRFLTEAEHDPGMGISAPGSRQLCPAAYKGPRLTPTSACFVRYYKAPAPDSDLQRAVRQLPGRPARSGSRAAISVPFQFARLYAAGREKYSGGSSRNSTPSIWSMGTRIKVFADAAFTRRRAAIEEDRTFVPSCSRKDAEAFEAKNGGSLRPIRSARGYQLATVGGTWAPGKPKILR